MEEWLLRQIPVYEGAPQKDSMTVAMLPAGTVLFRMFHQDESFKTLFREYFGIPTSDGFCLPPTYNAYFFPFPYVGFGLFNFYDQSPSWKYFNACTIYVTTQDINVAAMLSPSQDFRGTFQVYKQPTALVKRCAEFPVSTCINSEPVATKAKYVQKLPYDNCLNPATRGAANLGGMLAIANLDSLDQKRVINNVRTKQNLPVEQTAMGAYLRCLASYNKPKVVQILRNLYTDRKGNRGIPEIALHPLVPSQSNLQDMNQRASTFEDAIAMLGQDMKDGRLSFMPVATITDKGIFSYGGIRAAQGGTKSANQRRKQIEQNLENFLGNLRTEGFSGVGKLCYDKRTGFFCMDGLQKGGYADFLLPLKDADDLETMEAVITDFPGPATEETMADGNAFLFQRPADTESFMAQIQGASRGGTRSRHRKTRKQNARRAFATARNGFLAEQNLAVQQPLLNRFVNRNTLVRATTLRNVPKRNSGAGPVPIVLPTNPQPLSNEAASLIGTFYARLSQALRGE